MTQEIRNKLEYLILLKKNPLTDIKAIDKLKKELEYVNVAQFSNQDMQLLNQALSL